MNKNKKIEINALKKYSAFTLAEVLITLGIIGIVAAITIPTLMNNTNERELKTAYKKAYSSITNAWLMGLNEGTITNIDSWCGDTTKNNFKEVKAYFKVTKSCEGTNISSQGCWGPGGDNFYGVPDGTTNPSYAFIDSSGMSWAGGDGLCGSIIVDVNGFKKPNVFGKDRKLMKQVGEKVLPADDFTIVDTNYCPRGNCLYKTKLYD